MKWYLMAYEEDDSLKDFFIVSIIFTRGFKDYFQNHHKCNLFEFQIVKKI